MLKRPTKKAPVQRKRVKLSDNTASPAKPKSAPAVAQSPAASTSSNFDRADIVVGSYERILYGLQVAYTSENGLSLTPVFSFPAHLACIKTVSCSDGSTGTKHWLATASTDDTIKIWDLSRRKEVGLLVGHEAAATCIRFLGEANKFLLSASEDGTLKMFRTKDWALLRSFKGHKARVNSVDVHPAGRIALSVSADRTLRFWDLVASRNSAAGGGKDGSSSTKLGAEGDLVKWNTKGDRFAVICAREIRLFSVDMKPLATLTSKSRFHDVAFVSLPSVEEECMIVACEDGKGRIYTLPIEVEEDSEGEVVFPVECKAELSGHLNRIKGIQLVQLVDNTKKFQSLAVTASSDGKIHVYNLTGLKLSGDSEALEPVAIHDTKGSRLTSLAVTGYLQGARSAELPEDEVSESEEEEDSSDVSSDSDAEEEDEE